MLVAPRALVLVRPLAGAVVVALLMALSASAAVPVRGIGRPVAPLPVVPRGAYGWPLGPDRGVTQGAAGPPARAGDDGSVTRRFRAPPHPYGRGHRGVDLAGSPAETVRAAGAGTVAFAGRVAGHGVVSLDHSDGLRTTYEPVTASVTPGAAVARGAPLGVLEAGHAGCPVVACLHWGLRRASSDGPATGPPDYLDPLLLLGLGHVRLLPADP